VKYKINYYTVYYCSRFHDKQYCIRRNFWFEVKEPTIYVNGRRWAREGGGSLAERKKKYWFFTIYSGECFEISKVIYSKSSLTAAAGWKSAQLKNEFTVNILYTLYCIARGKCVLSSIYTDPTKTRDFRSRRRRRRRRRRCVHRTEAEKL